MSDLLNYFEPFICLIRHGETELSAARCYNGRRDVALTSKGERQAAKLAPRLTGMKWGMVLCSPLKRAVRTAELAGFSSPEIEESLIEFDYGEYEGKTTGEILNERNDWDFWVHGCLGGETPDSAGARLDKAVERLRAFSGNVLIFSHSHAIRIFTARCLGLGAAQASMFEYSPAHLSLLSTHRGYPVIKLWNDGTHLFR